MAKTTKKLQPYRASLAGTLLAAREAVMAPIRPILRDHEITEQQWRVLRVLDTDGELASTSLGENALLHAPSVTRILKELENRDYIARRVDDNDGRRFFISITTSGKAVIENTSKETIKILQSYSTAFGEERLNNLQQELLEFTRSIE